MGVFGIIRRREPRLVLRKLNAYLKFSARIAEAKESVSFINDCVQHGYYPKSYWKSIRSNRVRPNCKNLKRFALNQLDTVRVHILELERFRSQRQGAVDKLDEDLRFQYMDYVNAVCEQRIAHQKSELSKTLISEVPEVDFPSNPEEFVHNYTNLNLSQELLEALSLGLKIL
jgi:hypothetical protein